MTIGNAKWIFVDKNLLADKAGIEERLKADAKKAAEAIVKRSPMPQEKPS